MEPFANGSQRNPYKRFGPSSGPVYQTHYRYPRKDYSMEDDDGVQTQTTTSTETASSKYFSYPQSRPFINTDFTRADKPVNTYPTSDRDAVISALRNLQDKVKKLEIERTAAEENLQSLASETEQYKELLNSGKQMSYAKSQRDYGKSDEGGGFANNQAKELEGQLSSAENRCQLLEKQLDYMRNMVENSERNRQELMEKTLKAKQDKDMAGSDIKLHMDRLNELERDQLRLTATQTLAESKIRELEDRVREEKMHRKTLQERTAQLETASHNKRNPPSYPGPPSSSTQGILKTPAPQVIKSKKPPKKKKKKVVPAKRPASACRSEPMRHYRLNLAEIPFVAGKSTAPSHSLGANVQKVLSMMKSHNYALCSHLHANGDAQRSESPSSTGSSVTSVDQDLSDLLTQLQDEFGQLSSEHQEIMNQMHVARDIRVREELEQELDILVARMEAKSQQISKIRQHQLRMEDTKKVRPSSAKVTQKSKRPHSAGSRLITTNNHHHNHYHHHHSSQNGSAKPKPHNCVKSSGNSALGQPALFMLRDMKKLQTTLRRDDLSWE